MFRLERQVGEIIEVVGHVGKPRADVLLGRGEAGRRRRWEAGTTGSGWVGSSHICALGRQDEVGNAAAPTAGRALVGVHCLDADIAGQLAASELRLITPMM